MFRYLFVLPLVACTFGGPIPAFDPLAGIDTVLVEESTAELWADGTYDDEPVALRCNPKQLSRDVSDGITGLACTDGAAGFHVSLTVGEADVRKVVDCSDATGDTLAFIDLYGDHQLSCLDSPTPWFDLSIADAAVLPDGSVSLSGTFEISMYDGDHELDLAGGFDTIVPVD